MSGPVVRGQRSGGRKSHLMLDPFRVKPFADQPRKRFRGIKQLAESIRLVGQVTPIVVTLCEEEGFDAELVDGERRLQACRLGKLPIKAIFEEVESDDARFALSVAANFCRQEHDAIEISEAVWRLKDQGKSVEEIAGIFGKTGTWVYQFMALKDLAPEVQEMLQRAGDEARQRHKEIRERGRMTLSLALLLVPLSPKLQVTAARRIAKQKLSTAAARTLVRNLASAAGQQVGRKRSPRSMLQTFWNQTDTFRHAVERIVGMAQRDVRGALAGAKVRELKTLRGQIDWLCEELTKISDVMHEAERVASG